MDKQPKYGWARRPVEAPVPQHVNIHEGDDGATLTCEMCGHEIDIRASSVFFSSDFAEISCDQCLKTYYLQRQMTIYVLNGEMGEWIGSSN